MYEFVRGWGTAVRRHEHVAAGPPSRASPPEDRQPEAIGQGFQLVARLAGGKRCEQHTARVRRPDRRSNPSDALAVPPPTRRRNCRFTASSTSSRYPASTRRCSPSRCVHARSPSDPPPSACDRWRRLSPRGFRLVRLLAFKPRASTRAPRHRPSPDASPAIASHRPRRRRRRTTARDGAATSPRDTSRTSPPRRETSKSTMSS